MGHLGDPGDVVVDPNRPESQCSCRLQGPTHVSGPHRGGEPVVDVVGPAEGLLIVLEALDGHDGSEDLLLDDLAPLFRAGDDRRFDEETAAAVCPVSAGKQLYIAARLRPLQVAQYAFLLSGRYDWAHLDLIALRRIGGLFFLYRACQLRGEPPVHLGPRDDAGGRSAVLP